MVGHAADCPAAAGGTICDCLPPIYAPLDPKVAPLVEALRRDGFRTMDSCDGHVITLDRPWVNVAPLSRHWQWGTTGTLEKTLDRLTYWLEQHRVAALVCVVHMANRDADTEARARFPFLRVEVLTDLADADLGVKP